MNLDREIEDFPKVISNKAEVTFTFNNGKDTVKEETCTVQTCVDSPSVVKLYKSACPDPLNCSDKICYNLVVVNYKSSPITNVVVTDTLHAGLIYNNDATLSLDGAAPVPITPNPLSPLTFTIASIPGKSAAIIRFSVTIPNTIAPGTTIRNTATVTFAGHTGSAITASTSQHFSCARIEATKQGPACVECDEKFNYVISLHNTGDQDAVVTKFEDDFDDCLIINKNDITVVNHTGTPVIVLDANNKLTITGFTVPSGKTVVITVPAKFDCDCRKDLTIE